MITAREMTVPLPKTGTDSVRSERITERKLLTEMIDCKLGRVR
jgi:hypothetical protein